MPIEEEVIEKYWGWCKWKWTRYPCRKTRRTTKWCYDFSVAREARWLFYCKVEACEYGRKYKWSGVCLGFGSHYFYNFRKCFKNKLTDKGECNLDGGLNTIP